MASDDGLILPLVVMVSDDTEEAVRKLLEENKNFGMADDQISIVKQEKVACAHLLEGRSFAFFPLGSRLL